MIRKNLAEGFTPVQTKEAAEKMFEEGAVIYLCKDGNGVEQCRYIISDKNVALAVASTPPSLRADLVTPEGVELCNTFGNLLNKVFVENPVEFISDVQRFQLMEECGQVPYVEVGSSLDTLGEVLERKQAKKNEELLKNTLSIKTDWGTYDKIVLEVSRYLDGNTFALNVLSYDEEYQFFEPFATITVNLNYALQENLEPFHSFVDTNNCPWAPAFLREYGLAEDTGVYQRSGYCMYPLYKFNADKLRMLCPDQVAKYEAIIG